MSRVVRSVLVALFLVVGWSQSASAEIVVLIDNSKVYGTLVHYYDGMLTLKTNGGAMLKIPVNKVRAIRFKLPKPNRVFSTPSKSFFRQKKALAQGRIQDFIDCYSLQYQTMLAQQLGAMSLQDLAAMRKAITTTKYRVKRTRYKGNMAFLDVVQTRGKMSMTTSLTFVKENGEWKMVPVSGAASGMARPGAGQPHR
ncbi:MAG: hypothetical protein J7M25_15265 [Deltaproteobacteria bacterium]|nr:hypothetical protein [Deltaproteobacteria bacterium]